MRGLNAEQAVEAIRRGAEGCERSMGVTTERDLVKSLIDSMQKCERCVRPALVALRGGSAARYCDAHVPTHSGTLPLPEGWHVDVAYAPALRALLERMKAWNAPMPGAGEALLADEGDQR